jgi:hypothetical protein
MPTKLPHYILPLLPPVALLCARAVLSTRARPLPRGVRAAISIWALVGTAAAAGLIAIPVLLGDSMRLGAMLGAVGIAGCVFTGARAAFAGRWHVAIGATVAASVVLSVALLGTLLPGLEPLWLSRSAVAAIGKHSGDAATTLAAAGYHEPSLVFLAGGGVELVDSESLAAFIERHPEGLALLTAEERDRFDAAAAARGVRAQVVWSGDGIHYSKGRRTRLLLARISHQLPTAAADTPTPQGRTPSGLLDIVPTMPASASVRAASICGRLRALATEPGEKCGLVAAKDDDAAAADHQALLAR